MIDQQLLLEMLGNTHLKQDQIAKKLGITQQTISSWLARKKVPYDRAQELAAILDTDANSGLFGKTKEGDTISIKSIVPTVGAALNMDIDSIDMIEYGNDIVVKKDSIEYSNPNDLVAIPVSGVSMLPTIMPGEFVIIDQSINNYVGDDLYVLNFAGNLLVKRLQYDPATNSVEIISDNPSYKSYKVSLSDDQNHFRIIGKVITTIRR